ncbi:MAG TPA: nitric-oxide reductase large subunit [Phycisphaerae bacterium]|jgi:nitric oxide reductase subunit B|nr:nitric-oxide reductase large subunit [Phycisphaerae bacterium]HOB73028.1 nitric-oxide reductase large subunit [Phycisphaerae bacterium]HOJ52923.1 nitric-oxide reductase large subunit [Phycisphaerae bacterium]HOL24659.1 nitric-oxide reductase large subunit [Phycisphaerae bacterium]HPP19196.1 nitric-oxide reductase large subunit [Phycisphaerae bacterium]
MRYRRLWMGLTVVVVGSFAVLGYFGRELYRQAPPIPNRVVTAGGEVLFTGQDIKDGQNVWQSMGGQEVGTVWGHGAYVAPDWSADWLHREAGWILDHWAKAEHEKPFAELSPEIQEGLKARLRAEVRTNTYDPATGDLTVSPVRAQAIAAVGQHYAGLFGSDPEMQKLRLAYAIPENQIKDPERQRKMNAFFFWAAWACATERPGSAVTYTNNWPAEDLIGNRPSGQILVWSLASIILLLGGVGALAWYIAAQRKHGEEPHAAPANDPLLALQPTPSMRATLKYFWVVAALIIAQVVLGAVTAHYGVEGDGFYGIPLAKWLPYSVTRTWHTQLGIFWIATAWLATGLFIAPAVSGYEPKFQRAGVNFLFVCLLIIVVGSLFGQWLGVQQKLGFTSNFWFGHQGYEYVDLGRFWQLFLFVGLFVWLGLMVRAIAPAFRKPTENKHLLALFVLASAAIGLFYGAGLMWGRQTHLAMAEYWRWWVVHLWVEGFFEVFATVAISFLFTRMGLIRTASATAAVLFSSTLFLAGGIIGTMHHLYFTGTPTSVLALGAVFSALEIVPLTLIGFEAYENLSLSRAREWVAAYKWPIYFFIAVAFWNLVGAGLFGFLINTPIALYYMQGLNTTPVHGHTALFGVYGMLGIGLMLFCLKGLAARTQWKTGMLSFAFWSINIGLALMVLISLLPIGLMQTVASVEHGMWYARSAEFLQTPIMDKLRWLRAPGDTVFGIGIVALGWFVLGLKTGWSRRGEMSLPADVGPEVAGAELEPVGSAG